MPGLAVTLSNLAVTSACFTPKNPLGALYVILYSSPFVSLITVSLLSLPPHQDLNFAAFPNLEQYKMLSPKCTWG